MKKGILCLVCIVVVLTACQKTDTLEVRPTTPQLLFKSGFDEGIFISDIEDNYQVIRGTDSETDFTWPISILGSNFGGIHRIQDDNGAAIDNYLENTTGPSGTETTALFQRVNYDIGVTQTPYQINSIKENPKALFMTYWMKTDDTSLQGPDKWRAIWEYKTKNYNENDQNGFRMIAFMATDNDGDLHWLFQGDRNPSEPIWQVRNKTVPVIRNEWFKVSYYLEWSTSSNGYAAMYINDELIAEHKGPTTTNSDAMDFIILTQVYGNTHPMHQWIDDIEIWNGIPSATN
jgi:hypothetical protein